MREILVDPRNWEGHMVQIDLRSKWELWAARVLIGLVLLGCCALIYALLVSALPDWLKAIGMVTLLFSAYETDWETLWEACL